MTTILFTLATSLIIIGICSLVSSIWLFVAMTAIPAMDGSERVTAAIQWMVVVTVVAAGSGLVCAVVGAISGRFGE